MRRLTLRYGRVSRQDWVLPPRAAPHYGPYSGPSVRTPSSSLSRRRGHGKKRYGGYTRSTSIPGTDELELRNHDVGEYVATEVVIEDGVDSTVDMDTGDISSKPRITD